MTPRNLLITALFASMPVHAAEVASKAPAESPADYVQGVDRWHADREARLRKPDGWLSFIGSGRVDVGDSAVGSAADSDIVLAAGPARLGTLNLDQQGVLRFTLAADSGASIDGSTTPSAVLKTNQDGEPTRVRFGSRSFYTVKSGDVVGWRQRDSEAAALRDFKGIERFPVDPSWRIVADWIVFDPPKSIDLVTVINTLEPATVPGKAVFQRDGKTWELQPIHEAGDDQLFFILTDQTSGKETYAAARFLYTDLPKDGKVVLDFNKALNPPCALSPHVVCPTAPKENRLSLRIDAGEKTFRGAH